MKVAKDFDFARDNGGGNSKYDWARLFDGQVWELVHGEDFDCLPEMFRRQAYGRATKEGKRVRVHIREDHVFLQVRNGAEAA